MQPGILTRELPLPGGVVDWLSYLVVIGLTAAVFMFAFLIPPMWFVSLVLAPLLVLSGLALRSAGLLYLGALAAIPVSFYLGAAPLFGWVPLLMPILLVRASHLCRTGPRWHALLLSLPFLVLEATLLFMLA